MRSARMLTGAEARAYRLPYALSRAAQGDSALFYEIVMPREGLRLAKPSFSTQEDYDAQKQAVILEKSSNFEGQVTGPWAAVSKTKYEGDQARIIQNVSLSTPDGTFSFTGDRTGLADSTPSFEPYELTATLAFDMPCGSSATLGATHTAWRQIRWPIALVWGETPALTSSDARTNLESCVPDRRIIPTSEGGDGGGGIEKEIVTVADETVHLQCWAYQERDPHGGPDAPWITVSIECSPVNRLAQIPALRTVAKGSDTLAQAPYLVTFAASTNIPRNASVALIRRAESPTGQLRDAIVMDPARVTAAELNEVIARASALRASPRQPTHDSAIIPNASVPTGERTPRSTMLRAVIEALPYAKPTSVDGFGSAPSMLVRITHRP